mgnify:CR=1 FL=1
MEIESFPAESPAFRIHGTSGQKGQHLKPFIDGEQQVCRYSHNCKPEIFQEKIFKGDAGIFPAGS